MDLCEGNGAPARRHPWELARVAALRAIGRQYGLFAAPKGPVLDLGCGDGYIIHGLTAGSGLAVDAIDPQLDSDRLAHLANRYPALRFHNAYHSLPPGGYGVITMFDVLEHVERDVDYLTDIVARFAGPGCRLFCTVPAFQTLFGPHDTFLKHQRRYSRRHLRQVLAQAGLMELGSGYLFGLLLPLRAAGLLWTKVVGRGQATPYGVGHWQHGPWLTSLLTKILTCDNQLLLRLSRHGLTLPGLTVWTVCETPR